MHSPEARLGPAGEPPGEGLWRSALDQPEDLCPYLLIALGAHAAASSMADAWRAATLAVPKELGAREWRWYRAGVGLSAMSFGMGTFRYEGFFESLADLPAAEEIAVGAGFRFGRLFSRGPEHSHPAG